MVLVRTSVCLVLSGVPAVEVRRFITELPPELAKVTFSGDHVAPGTPGPPEFERTLQPFAEILGSLEPL
jgi:hypothetical protein